jgi:hypothetical protein
MPILFAAAEGDSGSRSPTRGHAVQHAPHADVLINVGPFRSGHRNGSVGRGARLMTSFPAGLYESLVTEALAPRFEALPESQRIAVGVALARSLVDGVVKHTDVAELSDQRPHDPAGVLRAVHRLRPDGAPAAVDAPLISLLDSALLTPPPTWARPTSPTGRRRPAWSGTSGSPAPGTGPSSRRWPRSSRATGRRPTSSRTTRRASPSPGR